MKKNRLYLFYLLFLPNIILSQKPVVLSLEGISLNIPIDGYYVEKVIDARKDKSNIGCIYNWIAINKKPIVLDGEMEIALKNIFNTDFQKKATDKALYIRLNDFSMRETDDEEIFISFIDITFLEKTDDGFIELLTTSGMASSQKTLLTRRKNNKENMEAAIEECLFDFNFRKKRNVLLHKKISSDRLLEKDTFAVPNLDSYPKGIFHTFTDFQLNTPDTNIKWQPKYSYSPTKNQISANISIDADKPWGFCDGKNVYIKTLNNLYVPLKNKDNHLIFYDNSIYEAEYTRKYERKQYIMTRLFGFWIGAAITPLWDGDTKRKAIEININNGLSSFYKRCNVKIK